MCKNKQLVFLVITFLVLLALFMPNQESFKTLPCGKRVKADKFDNNSVPKPGPKCYDMLAGDTRNKMTICEPYAEHMTDSKNNLIPSFEALNISNEIISINNENLSQAVHNQSLMQSDPYEYSDILYTNLQGTQPISKLREDNQNIMKNHKAAKDMSRTTFDVATLTANEHGMKNANAVYSKRN